MQCNWCHGAILEDPRNISDGVSVHYWCLDLFQRNFNLIAAGARSNKFRQLVGRSLRRLGGR